MVNRFVALSRILPQTIKGSRKAVVLPARLLFPSSFRWSHPLPETHPSRIDLTDDTLFAGRLLCRQHRDGYRFSVDAVLAAHFAGPKSGQRVLDLGGGCGVIGLILVHRLPEKTAGWAASVIASALSGAMSAPLPG
jgi:hypothetical protein